MPLPCPYHLLYSCAELQEAVARQLLSSDPVLQTAALRCLAAFKLPFLSQQLLGVLLQLADVAKLRGALVHVPAIFDTTPRDEAVDAALEQQRLAQQQLRGKKAGGGEVARVDASSRPGAAAAAVVSFVICYLW
jgi:hypothetical protein